MTKKYEERVAEANKLFSYINKNTIKSNGKDDIDMIFFKVKVSDTIDKKTVLDLIKQHKGHHNEIDLFDGKEHSYIELGGWIGDQGGALTLMAVGKKLKLWELLTPRSMLGDMIDDEMAQKMAGSGMITIKSK